MNFASYGHLQFKKWEILERSGLATIILVSWGIALFEYIFQVPRNRLGSNQLGGPFDLYRLKILQEIITLSVFSACAIFIFKTDKFEWNYIAAFAWLMLAVFFIYKLG